MIEDELILLCVECFNNNIKDTFLEYSEYMNEDDITEISEDIIKNILETYTLSKK